MEKRKEEMMDNQDIDQLRELFQELEQRAYGVKELVAKAQKAEKQGFDRAAASYKEEAQIAMKQVETVCAHMVSILQTPRTLPA